MACLVQNSNSKVKRVLIVSILLAVFYHKTEPEKYDENFTACALPGCVVEMKTHVFTVYSVLGRPGCGSKK